VQIHSFPGPTSDEQMDVIPSISSRIWARAGERISCTRASVLSPGVSLCLARFYVDNCARTYFGHIRAAAK
jgi:hypothetical protein